MANYRGVKTVNSGCVFAIDGVNYKSYTSGSTDTYNLINTSQTGSLKNGISYTDNSWVFDGTDDHISIPSIVNTTFTYEIWFKSSGNSGTYGYFFGNSGIAKGFAIDEGGAGGGGFGSIYYFSGGANIIGTLSNPTNWNHIVFVARTTENKADIYVNGQPFVLDKTINSQLTDINQIGSYTNIHYLGGDVSNVKIYNRALTAQEVLTNYNATKHRFGLT